jgi:hypothetical protein
MAATAKPPAAAAEAPLAPMPDILRDLGSSDLQAVQRGARLRAAPRAARRCA